MNNNYRLYIAPTSDGENSHSFLVRIVKGITHFVCDEYYHPPICGVQHYLDAVKKIDQVNWEKREDVIAMELEEQCERQIEEQCEGQVVLPSNPRLEQTPDGYMINFAPRPRIKKSRCFRHFQFFY